MASLIKQHGRYYLQFYDAGRTPKQKRKALGVTTKQDAKRLKRRLESLFAAEQFDPWFEDPQEALRRAEGRRGRRREALTLKEALSRFLATKRRTGRAETTLRTYRHIVGLFARKTGEETKLVKLSPSAIRHFCHDDAVAPSTRRTRYKHLRAFLRWCADEGYGSKGLTEKVEAPPQPEKLPKAVMPEELEKICATMRADYEEKLERGACREGEILWLILLFRFALYSGLRASELGRLRWRDIDLERSLLYVCKQKNKREQTVPLARRARDILEQQQEESGRDTGYVFGPPDTPESRSATHFREYVSKAFRRYRKKADIERPISFHGLRHGFCTLLAEAGKSAVVIKEAARHGDISTSMRYVHMANQKLKEELDDAF